MESVPGAIATESQPIATIEIARIVTRSLPLPVLTLYPTADTTRSSNVSEKGSRLNVTHAQDARATPTASARNGHRIGFPKDNWCGIADR
jgi:hypothetical protein